MVTAISFHVSEEEQLERIKGKLPDDQAKEV